MTGTSSIALRRVKGTAGQGTDLLTTSISFTPLTNVENANTNTSDPLNLTGNMLAILLNGNDAANTLTGLGRDDNLLGKDGSDVIIGGTGADPITVFRVKDDQVGS